VRRILIREGDPAPERLEGTDGKALRDAWLIAAAFALSRQSGDDLAHLVDAPGS
jgi:hypothetical protein